LPISQNAQAAGLPVVFVHINKDKIVMSATAVVRIAGGQVFFPDYDVAPWMHEFVAQLLGFPAGAHDDDVSMISIGAHSIFEQKQGSPTKIVTLGDSKPRFNAAKVKTNGHSKSRLFGMGSSGNGH